MRDAAVCLDFEIIAVAHEQCEYDDLFSIRKNGIGRVIYVLRGVEFDVTGGWRGVGLAHLDHLPDIRRAPAPSDLDLRIRNFGRDAVVDGKLHAVDRARPIDAASVRDNHAVQIAQYGGEDLDPFAAV